MKVIDYGASGLDIQTAMVQHVKANPDRKTRSDFIFWNGKEVRTSLSISVPPRGQVRLEFLSGEPVPKQGVDIKAENGGLLLSDGQYIETLRTWWDDDYEPTVEYSYVTATGSLKVWNVYERRWPDGRVTTEKWTGNSGFWVESAGDRSFIFHCSPGTLPDPNFEFLVVRLTCLGETMHTS